MSLEFNKTEHSISLIFHILFLFVALSLLFVFYISKLETQIFQNEINDRLTSTIPSSLSKNDTFGIKKSYLKNNQTTLNDLKNYYSSNTNNTETNNKYLKIIMVIVSVNLLLFIILPYTYLKFVGNYHEISLGKLFLENLVLFIFVGGFEIFFFINYARNYVPVLPSVFVNNVYSDLQS